jgi:hypothetical protein
MRRQCKIGAGGDAGGIAIRRDFIRKVTKVTPRTPLVSLPRRPKPGARRRAVTGRIAAVMAGRLCPRNNVGKPNFSALGGASDAHLSRFVMLNAFRHPWRYPVRAVPVVFRTKPRRCRVGREAAFSCDRATSRTVDGEWACRPKPSSSWLCGFVRNKKRSVEGEVRPWTLKQACPEPVEGFRVTRMERSCASHPPSLSSPRT